METVTDFIFLGSKITIEGGYSHETKRCLLFGKKAMTNLDSILKSKDITLSTMVLCCAWSLSCVRLFATLWTAAHQVPLSMGILQARMLKWVAMPSSWGSSQQRDRTQVSHIAGTFFNEPPGKPCWQSQSYDFSSSHVRMWELDQKKTEN